MLPSNVLILGAPGTGKIRICQHVTKDYKADTISSDSHSGVLYDGEFSTKYYKINLNLLVEEYPDSRDLVHDEDEKARKLREWYEEFRNQEYKELRDVLNGFIFTFDIAKDSIEYLKECLRVVDQIRSQLVDESGEDEWKGFIVIAGVNSAENGKTEAIEDEVLLLGLEFVNISEKGMNEYHERIGIDRLYEIFESHEWEHMDTDVKKGEYEQSKRNKLDEMTKGLLEVNDEEAEEEDPRPAMDLEEVFQRLQIAKDSVKDMNESQRKKYANKVIEEMLDFI